MPMKILIIKLGAIGDVLRTSFILEGLKKRYADCEISWITKKSAYDILRNNDSIDNLFTLKDKEKILKQEFDLVISLDDEDEAGEIASKVSKKQLIGAYAENGEKKYTDSSAPWFDMGLTSRFGKDKADQLKKENKETYQQILAGILDIDVTEPVLNLTDKEKKFAEGFFSKNKIGAGDLVVGLNTGAGKRWPMKKLSEEKTAELADMVIDKLGAKVILLGGPEEEQRNKKIISLAKNKLIDAGCKNSLMEFAAILSKLSALVVSDSLAMNMAIALKVPVVAFFGPTSAAEIELYGRGKKIYLDGPCYCCYKKEMLPEPNCISEINPKMLFDALKEVLK